MSERVTCFNCGKRRIVKTWFHVGGVVLGLLIPACKECTDSGWEPQEGRDYQKETKHD